MAVRLLILLLFSTSFCSGQIDWNSKYEVNKHFEFGAQHQYLVKELGNVPNLIFGSKYEIDFVVNLVVVDTASGGAWFSYSSMVNSVTQRNDSTAYILASLMDHLMLYLYFKDGRFQPDSATYHSVKLNTVARLDSINTYSKKNALFVEYLRNELKKDVGLEILLSPLTVFSTFYSSGVYKKYPTGEYGYATNLLNKPQFGGSIVKEWKATSKDSLLRLDYTFTGDSFAAAQYFKTQYQPLFLLAGKKKKDSFFPPEMKFVNHYSFKTKPNNPFPVYLYSKTVSEYFYRSVSEIEIREL